MTRRKVLKWRAFKQELTTSRFTSREPKKVLLKEVLCQFAEHPGIWGRAGLEKPTLLFPKQQEIRLVHRAILQRFGLGVLKGEPGGGKSR